MNPRLLSNNLLLPFLTSILEEYFKSTFIALLKYSEKKDRIISSSRLSNNSLVKVSFKEILIEEAIAESLSFQRISLICKNFIQLDQRLDFEKVLKIPYRQRKISLYDSLEEFVIRRHRFIHKAEMDISFQDSAVEKVLGDLQEAITRSYKLITEYYGWPFIKHWNLVKKQPTKREFA